MAHFYATVQGNRGGASRMGSKASGIRTATASWEGSVTVNIHHDDATGKDIATVSLSPWHGSGVSKLLYRGPVGEYKPEGGA